MVVTLKEICIFNVLVNDIDYTYPKITKDLISDLKKYKEANLSKENLYIFQQLMWAHNHYFPFFELLKKKYKKYLPKDFSNFGHLINLMNPGKCMASLQNDNIGYFHITAVIPNKPRIYSVETLHQANELYTANVVTVEEFIRTKYNTENRYFKYNIESLVLSGNIKMIDYIITKYNINYMFIIDFSNYYGLYEVAEYLVNKYGNYADNLLLKAGLI